MEEHRCTKPCLSLSIASGCDKLPSFSQMSFHLPAATGRMVRAHVYSSLQVHFG